MRIKDLLRIILGIIFIGGGINHFINPDFYLKIMPDFLPYPVFLNYASGALEIIGGTGLLLLKYRLWASYLIMVLLFLFLVVHIDHVTKGGIVSSDITFPLTIAWIRLVFQGILIYWAYWVGTE